MQIISTFTSFNGVQSRPAGNAIIGNGVKIPNISRCCESQAILALEFRITLSHCRNELMGRPFGTEISQKTCH